MKKKWDYPEILSIGLDKTQKTKSPGHGQQPNDVWCCYHNMYHGNDHGHKSDCKCPGQS